MHMPPIKESTWKTYKRLFGYLKPYRWMFVGGIITGALFSAVDVTIIDGMQRVIDEGFVEQDERFLYKLPLYLIIAMVLRSLFNFMSEYAMGLVGRGIMHDIRMQLFGKYLTLPASFFDARTGGEIVSTMTYNVERIGTSVSDAIKDLVRDLFLIIGAIGLIFYHSWQLGLIFFIGGPLVAWVLRAASKRFKEISRKLQNTMSDVTQVTSEAFQGYRTIKTFSGESQETQSFYRASNANRRQQLRMVITKSISSSLVYSIAGLALAGVILVSADLILSGKLTPGGFTVCFTAMASLSKPLKTISSMNVIIQQAVAAAQSIFAILDRPDEPDNGTVAVERARGEIEFKSLTFNYPSNQQPVLRDIHFHVPQGKSYALVGKSGSGKSTITNLLLRFYPVQPGQILLDGRSIEEYQLADFRKQFALVSQHVTLFDDTVRNNIAYGINIDASEERIIEVARQANAWEFIQKLPQGLDTIVGDNGTNLSGGQRQRIAIARALLKDAPVLILDEATSALDNESERLVQNALDELMRNRTTIVIAHRLSTIEKADQILLLHEGQIIEQGTHQELLAMQGEYAKLHANQFRD